MDPDKQWRLENGDSLKGATLRHQQLKRPSEDWDHDHCSCCWAKFAEWDAPEIQHQGYTTTSAYIHGAGYEWVCETCFADLKDEMQWQIVP